MTNKANNDVRTAAKNAGIALWMLAAYIGVSEPTITRWMRFELSDEVKKKMFMAIRHISEKKEVAAYENANNNGSR